MDRDGIVNEFLRLYLADESAGKAGPVSRYSAQFPGHEALIAEEYARLQSDADADAGPGGSRPRELTVERPGAVGSYAILETLGEGGMGRVYLAEQREPVRRRVALKVIRLGLATDEVLARFEAERQALAMMEHDSIAKIYDAGTTDDGQPYFVMEYVPGVPITEHCDRERLGVRRRLRLFQQVCEGVQHAHQKGVIHRDLKPSNVLVTVQQGRAVPKIIDFGVARATDQGGGEGTLLTRRGQVIGTPEYMSPEQAGASAEDVDTRTDIYSLGVMLYELLAGELPFAREELRRGGVDEIQSVIREVEPRRPSTRLAEPDAARRAHDRGTTPTVLARELRGDLDWIVMMAIEKDRNRRYGTANELTADIGRFLAHHPIVASPPSVTYLLRKFTRRYRLQVAAATAIIVALVAGLLTSLAFYRDAVQNQRLEQAARVRAQTNFARAREAVDAMLIAVGDQRLRELPFMGAVRRQLLEEAAAFHEAFLSEASFDPTVREETADTYAKLGGIQFLLGRHDQAERSLRRGLELWSELIDDEAAKTRPRLGRAAARRQLAQVFHKTGRVGEAEAGYRRAIDELRVVVATDPSAVAPSVALADAWRGLGNLLQTIDPERARGAFAESLTLLRQLVEDAGGDAPAGADARVSGDLARGTLQQRLANALADHGTSLLFVRRREAAEREFREARQMFRALVAGSPGTAELRSGLARVEANLLSTWGETGRSRQAVEEYPGLVGRLERLAADFPQTLDYRDWLAGAYNNYASELFRLGRGDEQRTVLEKAVGVYEPLVARYPEVPSFRLELARSLTNLGKSLTVGAGNPDGTSGGEEVLRRAADLLGKLRLERPDDSAPATLLATTSLLLSSRQRQEGRVADAQQTARQALAVTEELCERFPGNLRFRIDLPPIRLELHQVALALGDAAGAGQHLAEALDDQLAVVAVTTGDAFAREYARHIFGMLVRFRLERGEHVEVAEKAEAFARAFVDDAEKTYEAACALARCTAAARADAGLTESDRAARAEGYAGLALALLRSCAERGFRDVERARSDADLAALRGSPEFEAWLRGLDERRP